MYGTRQGRRETWTRGGNGPPNFFIFILINIYIVTNFSNFFSIKSHFASFNIIIDSFRSTTLATKFSITFLQIVAVVNFYWFASRLITYIAFFLTNNHSLH